MPIESFVLAHEPALRLGAFAAVLALMVGWEFLAPRRARTLRRRQRWPANLSIVVLNTLIARLLFPAAAAGVALAVESRGWGLLSLAGLPGWATLVAGVVLLDLAIYLQHALFHAVPALWRLHRMHHADLDIDVTTGARFHPVEIVLSLLIKFAVIAALGVPPAAVVLFEILLNATSMFNHSNARVAPRLEQALRWLVVTPDMHRVHHSVERDETNSNFGFNLPLWDRLFGTYRAQPRAGHEAMTIGIPEFRNTADCSSLLGMLAIPFRASATPARRLRGQAAAEQVGVDALQGRIAAGEAVTVLDVRGPDEYHGELGHIAGSLNVPLGDLPGRLGELRALQQQPIVIVCRTDVRSARAAALLRGAGFRRVDVLRGGMTEWKSRQKLKETDRGQEPVHPQ